MMCTSRSGGRPFPVSYTHLSLSVTSGGSFTAWFDCDEIFTDHAVTVYGSLKKGLKTANIEG